MHAVLVLLASFNGNQWLDAQVQSILRQKNVRIKLVVGDDLSNDTSIDRLRVTAIGDDRIQIIQFQERSGGAGQNFIRLLGVVDISEFDFVSFSDQDDVWDAEKIIRAVGLLNSSNSDGYSSAVTAFWPDGKEKMLKQSDKLSDIDFLFEGMGQGCTFVLGSDFARKIQDFIRTHRGLTLNIHYHDWLIYALSRVMRRRWVFDNQSMMRYRQHEGNDTGARNALAGIIKRIHLIRGGWYSAQVREIIAVASTLCAEVIPDDFISVWIREDSVQRRLSLAWILLRRGRRRLLDRIVLALSSLLGWI